MSQMQKKIREGMNMSIEMQEKKIIQNELLLLDLRKIKKTKNM